MELSVECHTTGLNPALPRQTPYGKATYDVKVYMYFRLIVSKGSKCVYILAKGKSSKLLL